MPEPNIEARRQRVARAEAILDQWLDLFETVLQRAHDNLEQSNTPVKPPDVAKLTDLANVFTITRRAYEIDLLTLRYEDTTQQGKPLEFDPQMLIGPIRDDDQEP